MKRGFLVVPQHTNNPLPICRHFNQNVHVLPPPKRTLGGEQVLLLYVAQLLLNIVVFFLRRLIKQQSCFWCSSCQHVFPAFARTRRSLPVASARSPRHTLSPSLRKRAQE